MKLKLDLHIHTFHSSDSVNTFKEINKRCYEEGLDGYAICDHDSIKGYDSAFMKKGDLILVPGVEITARGAHILCFNPNDSIQRNLPISETVDKIHDQGALAVLAHPYGIPRSIVRFREAEETGFDAIEVANAAEIPYSLIAGYNRDCGGRIRSGRAAVPPDQLFIASPSRSIVAFSAAKVSRAQRVYSSVPM